MTIDTSLPDMLLFAAVVREGGFTAAATVHGISKQSASDRIARLEARLGVRLLERTTRRVRPTEVGAAYYERCSRIAADVDEANLEVRSRQAEPTGLLRISAPYLFGRRFLGPIIAATLHQHPKVRVELVLSDRRTNLVEEGFDLAIRVGALDDSSYASRRLGNASVSVVATPRFLGSRPAPSLDNLAAMESVGIRAEEEWLVQGKRLRVRPKFVANDLEVASQATLASVGAAFLPELITREDLRTGRLVRVLGGAPVLVPVHVLYPSRRFVSAKVRTFIDRLVSARQSSWLRT